MMAGGAGGMTNTANQFIAANASMPTQRVGIQNPVYSYTPSAQQQMPQIGGMTPGAYQAASQMMGYMNSDKNNALGSGISALNNIHKPVSPTVASPVSPAAPVQLSMEQQLLNNLGYGEGGSK